MLNREARIFRSFSLRLPRGLEKNKTFLTLTLNVRGFNPVHVSLSIQDNAEVIACCEAKALANARLPEGLTPGQHYDATLKLSHENGFDEIPFSFDVMDANVIPLDFTLAHLLSFHICEHNDLHAFASLALAGCGAPSPEETLEKLYHTLSEKGLSYLLPPTPIAHDTQHLRSIPHVLKHGGTCTDLSLLTASLLHCCGKYPALLLFADHMAAGVFTATDAPAFSTLSDVRAIQALAFSGELLLVETTDMTSGRKSSFEKARLDILTRLSKGAPCVLVNTAGVLRSSACKTTLKTTESEPAPQAAEIKCPVCGYLLPENAKECPCCGESLPLIPQSAAPAVPKAAARPVPVIMSSSRSVMYITQPGHALASGLKKDEAEIRLAEKHNGLPVTGIYDRAFENRPLRFIHMPHTVKSIGSYAFSHCPLPAVALPPYLKEIKNGAFYHTGLQEIVIPHMVKVIPTNAFANCRNLRSVTLPDGLERIESGAFSGCPQLTSVTIPASVKSIAPGAFDEECELLQLGFSR